MEGVVKILDREMQDMEVLMAEEVVILVAASPVHIRAVEEVEEVLP